MDRARYIRIEERLGDTEEYELQDAPQPSITDGEHPISPVSREPLEPLTRLSLQDESHRDLLDPFDDISEESDDDTGHHDRGTSQISLLRVDQDEPSSSDQRPVSADSAQRASALENENTAAFTAHNNSGFTSSSIRKEQTRATPGRTDFLFSLFFLLGFATIFLLVIAALEILNVLSSHNDGIVSADESLHYLWTYGPTFLLTILAAIWGQCEYRMKLSAPWLAMRKGPSSADASLILDYLTPLDILSLVRALKLKHFPVALVILVGLLVKATTIISTGLLSLESRHFIEETNLITMDTFNLSKTLDLGLEFHPVNIGFALWAITQYNASYPPGTTPEIATSSLVIPHQGPAGTLSANLPVFEASSECTPVSWTMKTADQYVSPILLSNYLSKDDLAVLSPYCQVTSTGTTPLVGPMDYFPVPITRVVDLCPNTTTANTGTDTHRIFLSLRKELPNNVTDVVALLCEPTYSLTERRVTTSPAGDILSVLDEPKAALELGVSPSNLTRNILSSVSAYVEFINDYSTQSEWFALLNYTAPVATLDAYNNLTFFSDNFRRVFQTVAAQVVKTREMSISNQSVAGVVEYDSSRLVLVPGSLRAMEVLLGLMAAICLGLSLFKFGSLPPNSGALMTIASVLSNSPHLTSKLRGSGILTDKGLRERLQGDKFYWVEQPDGIVAGISIQPRVATRLTADSAQTVTNDTSAWWQPVAGALWYRILVICATLCVFISLEVLLHYSSQHGGIADVDVTGYAKYGWLYVPAGIMVAIALAYTSVDWATRTLHNYQELRKPKANNVEPIIYDPFDRITLLALPGAVKGKHVALSAGMVISILAPLLTIVTSGLFTPALVAHNIDVSIPVAGWFDINNASQDDYKYVVWDKFMPRDAIYSQAIQFNNLSFPLETFDEFAFAALDTSSLPLSDNNATLQARLPAARGQLNCTANPSPASVSGHPPAGYYIPITPPEGCTAGPNATSAAASSSLLYLTSTSTFLPTGGGYFGAWAGTTGTYWTPPDFDLESSTTDLRVPYSVCADGRQHLFFYYGYASSNTSVESLQVLHCVPYVEALQVDATLTLPHLEIDRSAPVLPAAVEDSAVAFSGANSVPLPFKVIPENGLFSFDMFFYALTTGFQGTPAENLINVSNANTSISPDFMIAKMKHLYAQLVAQSLHINYRVDKSHLASRDDAGLPSFVTEPVTAKIVDMSHTRLLQAATSTRILQVLLIALLGCALASFVLNRQAQVLPAAPGSIAARMALLAESEVLARGWDPHSKAQEYEQTKNPRVNNEDILEADEKLILGWWHIKDGQKYQGDVARDDTTGRRYYGIDILKENTAV